MAGSNTGEMTRLGDVKEKMMAILTPGKQKEALRKTKEKPVSVWRDYSGAAARPLHTYDEITPHIILGDGSLAQKKGELKLLKVTHVINACQGKKKFFQIDTDQEYYDDCDIKFFGLENAMDTPNFKISIYFQSAADFIDSCVNEGGKVYVHCYQGISRSATLVIAYLMIKTGMSLDDAIAVLRRVREVHPNDGFLKQLIQLEVELGHSH